VPSCKIISQYANKTFLRIFNLTSAGGQNGRNRTEQNKECS
jgi:hypothetical protein